MVETSARRMVGVALLATAAFVAACGDDSGGGGGAGGAGTGSGGATASSTTTTTTGATTATSGTTTGTSSTATSGPGTAASSSVTSGAGGGAVSSCDGVDPSSVHAQTAVDFATGQTVSLCDYEGDVLMIVNIAAHCGYTPQMTGLQLLEDTFSAEGFHVLGFLSNDFDQAGTHEDVEACNAQHGVDFQEYDLGAVTTDPQPVFAWIQSQANPGPAADPMAPVWNFNKYIVARDGSLVGHYTQTEYWGIDTAAPEFEASAAVQKIREELAK